MDLQNLNIYWIMIGISIIVISSYLFNFIASVTRIPSVIMLIISGYFLSFAFPVENLNLTPFLEFLGAVGLIMIVLEASLDLELKKEKKKLMIKAVFLALFLLVAVSALGGLLITWAFDCSFTQALFYSVPLSIMSSAIIIPSVGHLKEHNKEFLIYEAAFSDIFGIMIFYFLQDSLNLQPGENLLLTISSNLLITGLVSILLGYFVTMIILKVKAQVKLFLPIAVLILLYSIGKLFHLSSLIFILTFGLIINNRDVFFRGALLKLVNKDAFSVTLANLKVLTLEVSFLIRTFFFIVFGMTISLIGMDNPNIYTLGGGFLLILYIFRFLFLKGVMSKEVFPALWIAPRGLISILLFFAIPSEMILPGFNSSILLAIILVSNLVMTYGLMKYSPGKVEKDNEQSRHSDTNENI